MSYKDQLRERLQGFIGKPLTPETHAKFLQAFKAVAEEVYGPPEINVEVTSDPNGDWMPVRINITFPEWMMPNES